MKKPVLPSRRPCSRIVAILLIACAPLAAEVKTRIGDLDLSCRGLFRGYLENDQRLQWSGQELSFGAEAELAANLAKKTDWGGIEMSGLLFIGQPFGRNILTDETRAKYMQNFQRQPFSIKELAVLVRSGSFTFGLGKHATLFGRDRTLRLSNCFFDYPFIRSEAIKPFETGLFVSYRGGLLSLDAAVTNGGDDLDNNSSKAVIARVGLQGESDSWAFGISAKAQDGTGSEWQKQYNNHAGIDFMVRAGRSRLAGEFIYDQYGFHRAYDIDDVFWGRSYYYRDLFYKADTPITGLGGHLDLQYETADGRWLLELNHGEYRPEKVGNPLHDDPIRRTIFKARGRIDPRLHFFAAGLLENPRAKEPLFKGASDYGFLLGLQFTL